MTNKYQSVREGARQKIARKLSVAIVSSGRTDKFPKVLEGVDFVVSGSPSEQDQLGITRF